MAQHEPSETAGDLLKRFRLASDLTQHELAARSQVSARTIGSIERGELLKPRRESLRLLAQALALSPQQFESVLAAVRTQRLRESTPDNAIAPTSTSTHAYAGSRQVLPVPPTPLVGREREVTLAKDVIRRADVRLLTLYGPPGVGKTRLALHLALDMQDEFADGIVFVALAPFREPGQVIAAIAQAVGLHETGTQSPEASLQEFMADKQLLLLLDNCEQALEACPLIGHILGTCASVKAIVTSREVLRVRGEHELSVPPLALADLAHLPPVEDLGRFAAVSLFVQRARAVNPAFTLTDDNGHAVAEICARLDGLPLAIELAAARVKLLPPHALLTRLDHRLRLLAYDMRDLPMRHHTLRGAIAWSYDLLTGEEQELFARLAVFSGGWTLEAAETICVSPSEQGETTLETLTSLVDKSLVLHETTTSGEARFSMLETIREYALEQLATRHNVDALRRRHAEYYVAFAEGAEPHFTGPKQADWFARTAAEYSNVLVTLQWAIEHAGRRDDSEGQQRGEATRADDALALGLRLAASLGVYWSIRGPLSEGRMWLEALLSLASEREQHDSQMVSTDLRNSAVTVRAKALRMAAQLAEHEYTFTRASAWLKESLQLYSELGDTEGMAAVLNRLGIATLDAGDYTQAEVWFEQCLALRQDAGDSRGMAGALTNMGVVALHLGEYEQARSRLEDALACLHQVGDISATGEVVTQTVSAANVLANLGIVTYYLGNYERAAELLEQSRAVFQQLRFNAAVAVSSHFLGNVARELGDMAGATSLYVQSLDLFRTYPHPQGALHCLEDVARLVSLYGQNERAARLLGAVDGLRASIPCILLSPRERVRNEREMATLRIQLGEEAFAVAWSSGRAMSLAQAIMEARDIATAPHDAPPGDVLHVAG